MKQVKFRNDRAVVNTTLAVTKGKPEKICFERDLNSFLCDTGPKLYQLSYQAISGLVLFCKYVTEPGDDMAKKQCTKDIDLNCGNETSKVVRSSQ